MMERNKRIFGGLSSYLKKAKTNIEAEKSKVGFWDKVDRGKK